MSSQLGVIISSSLSRCFLNGHIPRLVLVTFFACKLVKGVTLNFGQVRFIYLFICSFSVFLLSAKSKLALILMLSLLFFVGIVNPHVIK